MRHIHLILATVIIFHFNLFAGDRSNIRGMGMARTINAVSQGTDAIAVNPSNLGIYDGSAVTISLMPIGVMARTELFSLDVYKRYFTGVPGPDGNRVAKTLTEEDKNAILSEMPENPRTRAGVEIMLFGITFRHPVVGGIGFAVIERAGTFITMSKNFFECAFYGLDSLGSEYKFDGTDFSAFWYREYNLSYGRKLPLRIGSVKDVYAGLGLKLIHGFGVFKTDRQNSYFGNYPVGVNQYILKGNSDFITKRAGIDLLSQDSSESFTLFPKPAGTGFGIDLGVSSQVINGLRVALSFTDIGSITWKNNLYENVGGGYIEVTGVMDEMKDTLETVLKGKKHKIGSFKTSLPTVLRLGMAMDAKQFAFFKTIPGKLLIAFDYIQGLNKSLGNSTIPRFSLGVEYRVIRFVPIRTGLAIGGADMVRWAFGTGFNTPYFCLDIATEHFGMIFMPRSFQMVSFAIGMKVRI